MSLDAIPPEHLRQIVAAGIRAPSAENKHYLRFEAERDALTLVATDAASWNALPHRKALALLSYGAVVENMTLRAGTLGYAQNVHWQPEAARPERVARIGWLASSAAPDPLAAAIEVRHTNRRFYRRSPLEAATLDRISAAMGPVPETHLLWCDSGALRSQALRALRLAESERFRRRELHEELFSSVRFDKGWRATAQEGLPPVALAVEPPMRLPFAALRHWPVMRLASLAGAHVLLGLRSAYLPCALAPHIGAVLASGASEDERDWRAGRALQRAWLAAAAHGLAFQALAAPVVLSRQKPGNGWVDPPVQKQLQELLESLSADQSGTVGMFFRVGRAEPPQGVTERLPVERYWP